MHLIQSRSSVSRTIHYIILTIIINVFNACRKFVYCLKFTVHTLYCRNNNSILVCSSEHIQVILNRMCVKITSSQTFYCPVTFDWQIKIILVSNYLTPSLQSRPFTLQSLRACSSFSPLSSGCFVFHWKYSSSYILEAFSSLSAQDFLNTQPSREREIAALQHSEARL